MKRGIKESDWKNFRALHPVLLERFCRRVLDKVPPILSDESRTAHQRYIRLYRLLRIRDVAVARLFNDVRRSTAIRQILEMHAEGLLTEEELAGFSEELRERISRFADD